MTRPNRTTVDATTAPVRNSNIAQMIAVTATVAALLASFAVIGSARATEGKFADDCSKDVAAAYEKQRALPGYQIVAKQPGPKGDITNSFTFQQPDRMHNTLVSPDQPAPLETIAIGRWAWANQGGGWQELWPQFAQSVTSDVATTLSRPVALSQAFTCAGKIAHDGREYVAYRTASQLAEPNRPEGADNPQLARMVLVDAATGLPSYNLIGPPPADGKSVTPIMTTAYAYPADIKIEAPDAVPAGRSR